MGPPVKTAVQLAPVQLATMPPKRGRAAAKQASAPPTPPPTRTRQLKPTTSQESLDEPLSKRTRSKVQTKTKEVVGKEAPAAHKGAVSDKAREPAAGRKVPAQQPPPKPAVPPSPEEEVVARLQRACVAMRPAFQGDLPCRETEYGTIITHLRTAVQKGGSMQVLYISGMPGTGKTASVLRSLEQLKGTKGFPAFAPVHINAMRLGHPNAVFSAIRSQLPQMAPSGRKHAVASAPTELSAFFADRRGGDPVVLLLIDEIDHLVTKNQAVLYQIFDWLSLPRARLVVAAISNTMDLPERLLPRVASRFGIVRVDFAPYTRDQITQIIRERLKLHDATGAVQDIALRLCAARVAAASGDIRKALQILARTVEVRLSSTTSTGPAEQSHLDTAEKDLLRASPAAIAVAALSRGARRFLTAMLLELKKAQSEMIPLQSVATRYEKLVKADEEEGLSKAAAAPLLPGKAEADITFLADRLERMALIMQTPAGFGRAVSLGVGLDNEDLAGALEPVEENPGIQELIRNHHLNS